MRNRSTTHRRRRSKTWTLLLVVSVAAGCGSRALTLEPQPRSFTHNDYMRIYRAWTRDADSFSFGRLEDVLHVTATFESWEFRWAYVVRYARDHSLSPEARTQALRASLADARKHHRFFVTMAGNRYRESNLTSSESAWRVLLVDPKGRITVPTQIDEIEIGADERAYFPSVSPLRHAFRIVFPAHGQDGSPTIPPNADYVLLRFTGAPGRVDLRWNFSEPENASRGGLPQLARPGQSWVVQRHAGGETRPAHWAGRKNAGAHVWAPSVATYPPLTLRAAGE